MLEATVFLSAEMIFHPHKNLRHAYGSIKLLLIKIDVKVDFILFFNGAILRHKSIKISQKINRLHTLISQKSDDR